MLRGLFGWFGKLFNVPEPVVMRIYVIRPARIHEGPVHRINQFNAELAEHLAGRLHTISPAGFAAVLYGVDGVHLQTAVTVADAAGKAAGKTVQLNDTLITRDPRRLAQLLRKWTHDDRRPVVLVLSDPAIRAMAADVDPRHLMASGLLPEEIGCVLLHTGGSAPHFELLPVKPNEGGN